MSDNKKHPISKNLMDDIFLEHLSEADKLAIAVHLNILISNIDSSLQSIFDLEILIVKKHVNLIIESSINYPEYLESAGKLSQVALDTLKSINKRLNRKIREYHACSFACSTLQSRKYNNELFMRYKLLVLLCAIRLAAMGKHESAIHGVLNEVRQFANGNRNRLIAHLPSADNMLFENLIDELDSERNKEEVRNSIKNQLSHYFVSFYDSYNDKKGITRNLGEHDRGDSNSFVRTQHVTPDEDENFAVLSLKNKLKINNKRKESWEIEEHNAAQDNISAHVMINNSFKDPVENLHRAQIAKGITERIKVRDQSLACDYKILTEFEIQSLMGKVLADLEDDTEWYNTAVTIFFSILSGNSPVNLKVQQQKNKNKFLFKKNKSIWHFKLHHQVATYKQEDAVKYLVARVEKIIFYSFPLSISSFLPRRLFLVNNEEVQRYIENINKKHNTRITISRIAHHFTDYCRQQNIDPVLIDVILGTEDFQESGVPYANISIMQITQVFDKYLSSLCRVKGLEFTDEQREYSDLNKNTETIGSPLCLSDDEIRRVNKTHILQLKGMNTQLYPNKVLLHNYYTFYVYRLLMMASGFRPVTGAGGKLKDLNFLSRQYWISDKENRENNSARIIVLAEQAVTQIEVYIRYLNKVTLGFRLINENFSNRVDDVMSSKAHLLFFIDDDKNIIEVRPKTIAPYMDKQFPLQLNWHRHHIRSQLLKMNAEPSLVAGFMGHENMGQEGLGRYSGLSYNDFNKLSSCINSILLDLDFEVVEI